MEEFRLQSRLFLVEGAHFPEGSFRACPELGYRVVEFAGLLLQGVVLLYDTGYLSQSDLGLRADLFQCGGQFSWYTFLWKQYAGQGWRKKGGFVLKPAS